jgi:hypothetical protein
MISKASTAMARESDGLVLLVILLGRGQLYNEGSFDTSDLVRSRLLKQIPPREELLIVQASQNHKE